MANELDEMLNKLVLIITPLVKAIEAKPAITKDRYGDYMTTISRLANMAGDATPSTMLAIGVALQRAGANKNGVMSALRILGAM